MPEAGAQGSRGGLSPDAGANSSSAPGSRRPDLVPSEPARGSQWRRAAGPSRAEPHQGPLSCGRWHAARDSAASRRAVQDRCWLKRLVTARILLSCSAGLSQRGCWSVRAGAPDVVAFSGVVLSRQRQFDSNTQSRADRVRRPRVEPDFRHRRLPMHWYPPLRLTLVS
jgi:hypothetical protein